MHPIQLGVTSVTFRKKSVDEIIELARRAQLDGIEWGGDIHVPAGDLQSAAQTAEKMRTAGLSVFSYGSYFYGDKGESFSPVLSSAKTLGAPVIRIWAGRQPWENCSKEEISSRVSTFQQAADMAAKEQLSIAFEYHRNTFTQTKEGAFALLKAVNRPNVLCYWQPNPTISQEEQLAEIDLLSPYLSNVHVFYWSESHTRHPLAQGEDCWRQYLTRIFQSPLPHKLILEFVEGDDEKAFLQDAATLHNFLRYLK